MLYELLCLLIAALGAYGLYTLLVRFLSLDSFGARGTAFPLSLGIHVNLGFSYEELEEALLLLGSGAEGEAPVLLVECPLRREALEELKSTGAEVYLSYEEYYHEKR